MPRAPIFALATLACAAMLPSGIASATDSIPLESLLARVEWLASPHEYGSACIRIAGPPTIYIDPSGLSPEQCRPKADLILITHSHSDHFSAETIRALAQPGTHVLLPLEKDQPREEPAAEGFPGLSRLAVGEQREIQGVGVETVPAYNTVSQAHPRSAGWLGYVLTLGRIRVYHSGDTSFTPEMRDLSDVDLAFMTLRPTYMMSGAEMAQAAHAFHPTILIPVHWLEAERPEIERLKRDCPQGTRLLILGPR